jgi:hypothetical protein
MVERHQNHSRCKRDAEPFVCVSGGGESKVSEDGFFTQEEEEEEEEEEELREQH